MRRLKELERTSISIALPECFLACLECSVNAANALNSNISYTGRHLLQSRDILRVQQSRTRSLGQHQRRPCQHRDLQSHSRSGRGKSATWMGRAMRIWRVTTSREWFRTSSSRQGPKGGLGRNTGGCRRRLMVSDWNGSCIIGVFLATRDVLHYCQAPIRSSYLVLEIADMRRAARHSQQPEGPTAARSGSDH